MPASRRPTSRCRCWAASPSPISASKRATASACSAGGVQYNHPVAPGASLFVGASGNGNFYSQQAEFDLAQVALNVGGSYRQDVDTFALTYAYGEILLDDDSYRSTNGVGARVAPPGRARRTFRLTPQYARIDYSGRQRRARRRFLARCGRHPPWLAHAWQPVLNAWSTAARSATSATARTSRATWAASPPTVTVSPSPFWSLSGPRLPAQRLRRRHPADRRHAPRRQLGCRSARCTCSRATGARELEYQYQRNDSNLELYEYARNLVTLKLRYEFK